MFDKSLLDVALPITLLFASLLALIFLALSVVVVRGRFIHHVSIGAGGKLPLERAMRIHANFAEYTPLALILLGLLEISGHRPDFLYALGTVFVMARILHIIGMSLRKAPNAFRMFGILGTWLVILVQAIAGLAYVLG